jgi:hypothetical protein
LGVSRAHRTLDTPRPEQVPPRNEAEHDDLNLFSSSPLAVEVRREIVGLLSAQGISTRAIAPAVRASHMAVRRDRDAGVTERYTSVEPIAYIDRTTGEVLDAPASSVRGGGGFILRLDTIRANICTHPARIRLAP